MTRLVTIALRKAIRASLSARPDLAGVRIYDEAPRGASLPYITFGDAQWRDWSTSSDRGAELVVVLDVWTDDRGLRQALEIADRVAACLDAAPLDLEGHRLIDIRLDALDTRREGNGRWSRASLRFRAITETI